MQRLRKGLSPLSFVRLPMRRQGMPEQSAIHPSYATLFKKPVKIIRTGKVDFNFSIRKIDLVDTL
jgi:hypothetical protein